MKSKPAFSQDLLTSLKDIKKMPEVLFEVLLQSIAKYLRPIFKESDLRKFKTINKFLKAHKLPAKYAELIRIVFEEQLIRHIQKISIVQYQHMRLNDDWGDLGEQRISISYCRHILGIPNTKEVTQLDADRFNTKLSELTKPYAELSGQELREIDEHLSCELFYKQVDYSRESDINKLLAFLQSKQGFISGQLGIYRSAIFGPALIEQLDKYRVTTFLQETARTPANVLSIAAVVGGKHIAIRKESCETIFANKWLGFFKIPDYQLYFDLLNDFENVGMAFKAKALLAYQTRNKDQLEQKIDLFLDEMDEGLLWHEIGHGIVINDLLTKEDSAFGEALGVLGANIISVMKEILADWAPVKRSLRGPLNHFCKVAQKNNKKATRMLYVYFSDNWFLGEQTDNFGNHTDIMMLLIWKYVRQNGTIDFLGLKKQLKSPKGIFSYVLKEYSRITKYLENEIKRSSFVYENRTIDQKELQQIYKIKVKKIEKDAEETSLEFLVMLWAKILEDLPGLNKELSEKINVYLDQENCRFHEFLLKKYYGLKIAGSIRDLLLAEIKLKGFYYPNPQSSLKMANLLKYFDTRAKIPHK